VEQSGQSAASAQLDAPSALGPRLEKCGLSVFGPAKVENLAEDAPLEELQERFKFLGQLNQYHSSVEDEVWDSFLFLCIFVGQAVPGCPAAWCHQHARTHKTLHARTPQVVYPALDSKVKNVTVAYSVEHQEEVRFKCPGGGVPSDPTGLLAPGHHSARHARSRARRRQQRLILHLQHLFLVCRRCFLNS